MYNLYYIYFYVPQLFQRSKSSSPVCWKVGLSYNSSFRVGKLFLYFFTNYEEKWVVSYSEGDTDSVLREFRYKLDI